jgi:hypothetical protein
VAGLTNHYGLQILDSGDSFALNGQKYTNADRAEIDRLLYLGAQGHHHTGAAADSVTPSAAGTVVPIVGDGGTYASGTTVYYEYTWVDATGAETLPSPVVAATVPGGLTQPAPPTLLPVLGSGSLPAGDYYYAISAWVGSNANETVACAPVYVYLSAAGEITIEFPTPPTGSAGFNIYRLSPNSLNYLYLTSVTGSGNFTDDGSISLSCNRTLPTGNNSGLNYAIEFNLPSEPPTGYSWNLYQTTTAGSWTDSLLASVVSGEASYVDVGAGTTSGTPPLTSELIGSPSKIDLTTEVTGVLPLANIPTIPADQVGGFPQVVTFAFPGALSAQTGTAVWTSEFASAEILSVRASLGRGSAPAAHPVEVDVVLGTSMATPTYATIFPTGPLPQVPVGSQIGAPQAPPSTVTLSAGDSLSVDLTQVGGGATPTDHDLTINIYLLATVAGGVEGGGGSEGGGSDPTATAPPTFGNAQTGAVEGGTAGTFTVSAPTGLSAGDLLVAGVLSFATAGVAITDEWTLLSSDSVTTSTGSQPMALSVFTRTATSGDLGATYTVTVPAASPPGGPSANCYGAGIIGSYANAYAAGLVATPNISTTDATSFAPAETTTTANSVALTVIAGVAESFGAMEAIELPTGSTGLTNLDENGCAAGVILFAEQTFTTAGTSTTASFTSDGSVEAGWVAIEVNIPGAS